MRDTEREAETQAEGEAGSMHREPDVGLDPGSPGSRPGPKAGAKPLRHPGIPRLIFCTQKGVMHPSSCELLLLFGNLPSASAFFFSLQKRISSWKNDHPEWRLHSLSSSAVTCAHLTHFLSMRYREKWRVAESLVNLGTPKYIKQILTDLKQEIYSNTIIVGDFNSPPTCNDRSSRQKNQITIMVQLWTSP